MTFYTKFTMFGKQYSFLLNTDKLDRNYSDENYAYWVFEHDGHYFEINIWKDKEIDGEFTTNGKVYGFIDYENLMEAGDCDEEKEISFVETK